MTKQLTEEEKLHRRWEKEWEDDLKKHYGKGHFFAPSWLPDPPVLLFIVALILAILALVGYLPQAEGI